MTATVTNAPSGAPEPPDDPATRATSRFFHHRPGIVLGGLLSLPLLWLGVGYLGSLGYLTVTAFYGLDELSNEPVPGFSLENFDTVFTTEAFRATIWRSIGVAVTVTVIDFLIAMPFAFYVAKVANRRYRRAFIVAALLPLWAGYLVKAYAWRSILDPGGAGSDGGVLNSTFGWTPGFGLTATILVLAYLWLPYMILPIYAGLDRLPASLLDASSDLGAKSLRTFGSVVLPMLVPAIVAGSIFTFSLSLGDYLVVKIVGAKTQLIGNLIERTLLAPNQPLAAAFTMVPIVIMVVYLVLAKRMGAFENL